MSKVLAVIPAHMTSTRFPGKVLADICGKPMLQHVLDRVALAHSIDETVVALDPGETEEPLRKWCKAQGVQHYTGFHTTKDLLALFYQTARAFDAEIIVRITSDCPLIDPTLIDACTAVQQAAGTAYVSTLYGYPEGTDTEVFTFAALAYAHTHDTAPADREHVTWSIRNREHFSAIYLSGDCELCPRPHLWSIDMPEDLEHIRHLYERLPKRWGWQDVLKIEEVLHNAGPSR